MAVAFWLPQTAKTADCQRSTFFLKKQAKNGPCPRFLTILDMTVTFWLARLPSSTYCLQCGRHLTSQVTNEADENDWPTTPQESQRLLQKQKTRDRHKCLTQKTFLCTATRGFWVSSREHFKSLNRRKSQTNLTHEGEGVSLYKCQAKSKPSHAQGQAKSRPTHNAQCKAKSKPTHITWTPG